jgi:hypothetical protein
MRNEMQHQRAAIKRDEDMTDVTAWVTERFIAEDKESTVADITQALVMSEGRVRRALRASRDLVSSISISSISIWGPRRTALARIIRELRKEGGK